MEARTSTKPLHDEYFPPPPPPRRPSVWPERIRSDQRELVRFWPVIQNMVTQELRVRYQRSVLGFFWTLLNPLLMMVTLSFVFSQIAPDIKNYPLFLFAGMVPWGFLNVCLSESAVCIIQNEGLIRKIYLPKLVFPIARCAISLVTFLLSLVAMFVLLLALGARPTWSLLALPLIIPIFTGFVLGLSLVVATANTFYRDFGHLVSVFLQAWYFLTPILLPISRFPRPTQTLLQLNPAYYFVELFHRAIYEGIWPGIGLITASTVISCLTLGIGYVVFKSQEDKLVFRL